MKLLPRQVAAEKAGISVTTLFRLERQGEFPAAVSISPRRVGYLESEVDCFIQGRVDRRDAGYKSSEPRLANGQVTR